MTRHLSFNRSASPGYGGGTIGGVHGSGMVFPIALSDELADEASRARILGLAGVYEHEFDFQSKRNGASVTGSSSRGSLLFVGRIPLGSAERSGTLIPEAGFAQMSFSSTSQNTLGVPNVSYSLIDVGVGWEQPISAHPIFLFNLRAAYLALLTAGDLDSAAQYGRTKGKGFDGEAGVVLYPLKWLRFSLSARYTILGLTFSGTGTRFAQSANDQWVAGVLEVGFAL